MTRFSVVPISRCNRGLPSNPNPGGPILTRLRITRAPSAVMIQVVDTKRGIYLDRVRTSIAIDDVVAVAVEVADGVAVPDEAIVTGTKARCVAGPAAQHGVVAPPDESI